MMSLFHDHSAGASRNGRHAPSAEPRGDSGQIVSDAELDRLIEESIGSAACLAKGACDTAGGPEPHRGAKPPERGHVGECVAFILDMHGYDRDRGEAAFHDAMTQARRDAACEMVKVVTGNGTGFWTGRIPELARRYGVGPEEIEHLTTQAVTIIHLSRR
jgi:hypothetical protein